MNVSDSPEIGADTGQLDKSLVFLEESAISTAQLLREVDDPDELMLNLISLIFGYQWMDPDYVAVLSVRDGEVVDSRIFKRNAEDGTVYQRIAEPTGFSGYTSGIAEAITECDAKKRYIRLLSGDDEKFYSSAVCGRLYKGDDQTDWLVVARRGDKKAFEESDGAIVAVLACQTGIALASRRRMEQRLASRLIEKELEVARSIQQRLLPSGRPGLIGLDVAAINIPAESISGDYYDYITHEREKIGFAIADVAGKGVPAAMIMALTRTLLRSAASRYQDPGEILSEVNLHLLDDMEGFRYVTMFYAVLDFRQNTLRYPKAGHVPPLLFRARTGKCELLDNAGLFLGIFRNTLFETVEIELCPGDVLICYTDGVCDAVNGAGEEYGIDRLIQIVEKGSYASCDDLVNAVYSDILDYASGEPLNDDITLMALAVNSEIKVHNSNLPTRRSVIPAFVSRVWDEMKAAGITNKTEYFRVKLIIDELISNAIDHGNRMTEGKNIHVSFSLSRYSFEMVVRDEGEGFDWLAVFESISDRLGVLLNRGRGILITREISDNLSYNESGNEVYVLKRFTD